MFFFFFKKKTAYEMRISDWSSDVCSSDLYGTANGVTEADLLAMTPIQTVSYSYDTHGNKTKETISGTSGAVSVAQYSYDSKNRLLCTALRMNSATWGALPTSACTAATTGSAGPDRITRNSYAASNRITQVETADGTSAATNEFRPASSATAQVTYVIAGESKHTPNISHRHTP